MSRYSKYFLQHALWLDDEFCKYYVQDRFWCRQDVTDVPCVIFNFRDEAENWLQQCVKNDWDTSVRRLRSFLVYESLEHLQVHRLNDRQVIKAAARQLTLQVHKIVIEPKFGLAVKVDAATQEPLLPLAVEPASELDLIFRQIRQALDALLAAQQKSYDQIEAMLSKMSPAQRDLAFAKAAGKGLVVDALDGMVDLVKSLPPLIWSLIKKEWRIITFPQRLATSAACSTVALSLTPLEKEINHTVRPFTETGQQAEKLARIMYALLGDDECFTLLMDFARRYWDATHPLEKTRITASLFSDIVLTIIFALISAGVGAVANVIAKSQWLVKCAAKLEELALLLKRIGHRHMLPKIGDEIAVTAAADIEKSAARIESTGARGMPKPKPPKKMLDKIDDSGKKNYGNDLESSKKTTIADKKFKRKHLHGDAKDPYTLMSDGKPMGAKEGAMPAEMYGLREPPHGNEKLIKEGYPDIATRGDYKNFATMESKELPPGTKIYRIVDEGSSEITKGNSGCYWAKELPKNKTEWRSNYAVKDSWNDNGYYVEHTIGPDGLKVWEGKTAGQEYLEHKGKNFYLEGGYEQIYLDYG